VKTLKRFFIVGVIAFSLNFIWELSHYFLYIDLSGIPKYYHLASASFTDMLIILVIFAVISLKNGDSRWVVHPSKADYLFVAFTGIAVAILIELVNLKLGRWEYTSAMPTIFGIGLTPLIQLALTGLVSLIITGRIEE